MKIAARPPSFFAAITLAVAAALAGCGASTPGCVAGVTLGVEPAAAVIIASAKSPGNQTQFRAYQGVTSLKGSCPIPEIEAEVNVPWTNPDPIHISISSASDATNGLATCKGPTGGPVTLTATDVGTNNTAVATAQLTCQ